MHEQSLVRALLRQVDAICHEQNAQRVTEVRVEVGPLSGVEPMLLVSAFDHLKKLTTSAEARLVMDEVSLLAECRQCDLVFDMNDFVFRCPECGGNIILARGDTVQLVSVSVQCSGATQESVA